MAPPLKSIIQTIMPPTQRPNIPGSIDVHHNFQQSPLLDLPYLR